MKPTRITLALIGILSAMIALSDLPAVAHGEDTATAAESWANVKDDGHEDLWAELQEIQRQGNTPLTAEEIHKRQILQIKIAQRLASVKAGGLALEGQITDEHGNSLKDVEVRILKYEQGRYPPDGKVHTLKEETQILQGSFKIVESQHPGVHLKFIKSGYYSRQMQFWNSDKIVPGDPRYIPLLEGKQISTKSDGKNSIKVVMPQKGQITLLDGYSAYLKYHSNGRVQLLDLKKLNSDPDIRSEKSIQFTNPEGLPTDTICMYAKLDPATNKIQQSLHAINKNTGDVRPADVRIMINAPDAGFQLYTPVSMNESDVLMLEMRTAPKDGYQHELIITPDVSAKNTSSDGNTRIYFFFRDAQSHYGKGVITGIAYHAAADDSDINTLIYVFLQPNGSKNLEDGDKYDRNDVAARNKLRQER